MVLRIAKKHSLSVALGVVLALSACGANGTGNEGDIQGENGAGSSSGGEATDKDAGALAHLVPDELSDKNKIVWAVEPYYPPFTLSSDDESELVGINMDLAEEMSHLLGVEYEVIAGSFDGLIPGVNSGRYDVAIATMADTAERREEVDFIDYFQSGSAVFVAEGTNHDIASIEDLCGYSVGVVKGTFEVEDAEEQSEACASQGEDELDIQVFNEQAGMLLSLESGRSDAMLMDYVAGNYAATTEGGKKFTSVGDITDPKRRV